MRKKLKFRNEVVRMVTKSKTELKSVQMKAVGLVQSVYFCAAYGTSHENERKHSLMEEITGSPWFLARCVQAYRCKTPKLLPLGSPVEKWGSA